LGEEEEELVFQRLFRQQHRAADVIALLIVTIEITRVLLDPVRVEAVRIVEVAVRVELLVAVEIENGAVELIRAALGHNLNCAAARTTILGLVVRGQQLELGDVVERERDVLRAVRSGVHIGGAVNRQVVFAHSRSVDVYIAETAWAGSGETGGGDHAGCELEQIEVIAPVNGEVLNLLVVDCRALFARLGFDLELGGVGRHFNRVGDVADFKDRHAGRLSVRRIDHDARFNGLPESGRFNSHRVSGGLYNREGIKTFTVG